MTLDVAIDWLRILAAAVSARQLYPADHPRVAAGVDEACARVATLLGGRESLALFMAEDRLTCGAETVSGAGPAARRVFDALATYGYDRITITRGLSATEVHTLVTALAAAAPEASHRGSASLSSSAHLQFAALETRLRTSAPARLTPGTPSYVHTLTGVWQRIDRERVVDTEALESLVAPLVEIAGRHSHGLLPLARLESHDIYTAAHVSNVALLTTVIAEVMGAPPAAVREVGIAALLHDIGKMRVPESVLTSAARLTPEELALVRQHPETGACMLAATPGVPALASIVAYEHHLQAGGGGYPSVPKGWVIHPASAMTHVADVYDALRTNRPYRPALEHHDIIEMMMRDSRTVFDADVLEAFFEHVVPRTDRGEVTVVSPATS